MTDHHPSADGDTGDEGAVTAHGDDEQLSAHLDGEAAPGVAAHVAECPACRARVAELAAVSRVVAIPPPVARPAVERAVHAALAASSEEEEAEKTEETEAAEGEGERSRRSGGAAAPADDVVPLAPAARTRRRPPTWALSLAAAVLAVLVAVPLLVAGGGGTGGREEVAGRAAPPPGEADESAELPLAVGPDLGDHSDPPSLRQAVGDALRASAARAESGAPAPRPEAADMATGPTGPTEPAEAAQAGGAAGDPGDREVLSRCGRSLRSSSGARLGPLVYGATLRWQETPAVVLAYRVPGGEGSAMAHQVFVMAREDCRLLVFQRL